MIPYHYHEKYGTTIKSWPVGFQYAPYCRGPCSAVSHQTAQKLRETALHTPLYGQRNEDVFWNSILRVKANIPQSYEGHFCTHLQDMALRRLHVKNKLSAFDREIKRLRMFNKEQKPWFISSILIKKGSGMSIRDEGLQRCVPEVQWSYTQESVSIADATWLLRESRCFYCKIFQKFICAIFNCIHELYL